MSEQIFFKLGENTYARQLTNGKFLTSANRKIAIKRGMNLKQEHFTNNAARLEVQRMDDGICRLTFYGPITVETMKGLGIASAKATQGSRGLLFLLDRATLLFDDLEPLHRPTNAHQRIPGAMVVPDYLLPMFDRYSRASAGRGITRAVFVSSQLEQALRWLSVEVQYS